MYVPGVRLLGLNTAAFAVLGESMVDFWNGVPPFGASVLDPGVNGVESTLKRFFMLSVIRIGCLAKTEGHTCLLESAVAWRYWKGGERCSLSICHECNVHS